MGAKLAKDERNDPKPKHHLADARQRPPAPTNAATLHGGAVHLESFPRMSHFWNTLAVAALVIIGVWTACGKGMILGWLADASEESFPEWVNKPLFLCPPCMSSFWGTLIWIASGGAWELLIVFILALCGTLRLIVDNLIES